MCIVQYSTDHCQLEVTARSTAFILAFPMPIPMKVFAGLSDSEVVSDEQKWKMERQRVLFFLTPHAQQWEQTHGSFEASCLLVSMRHQIGRRKDTRMSNWRSYAPLVLYRRWHPMEQGAGCWWPWGEQ